CRPRPARRTPLFPYTTLFRSVISKLVQLKQAADLHTSTFNQYVAFEVARDGFFDQHVKLIRQVYRERRDAMLHALQEFFPAEVRSEEHTSELQSRENLVCRLL